MKSNSPEKWAIQCESLKLSSFTTNIDTILSSQLTQMRRHLCQRETQVSFGQTKAGHLDIKGNEGDLDVGTLIRIDSIPVSTISSSNSA